MTLDQSLLAGLVIVTLTGVVIALLSHRTRAKWRKLDLLRDFIERWVREVTVPTEVDAIRLGSYFRPRVENDERFALSFKLVPKSVRRQYEQFIMATSAYIESCCRLYEQVEQECVERTGLRAMRWNMDIREWPERILEPSFVQSIYEQVWNTIRGKAVMLEDISYNIKHWTTSGKDYRREGLYLFATIKEPYHELELAQAGDQTVLESAQYAHRDMMRREYGEKFAEEVSRIKNLGKNAENLTSDFRKSISRLEVS